MSSTVLSRGYRLTANSSADLSTIHDPSLISKANDREPIRSLRHHIGLLATVVISEDKEFHPYSEGG